MRDAVPPRHSGSFSARSGEKAGDEVALHGIQAHSLSLNQFIISRVQIQSRRRSAM
jgi:hypothetical protein